MCVHEDVHCGMEGLLYGRLDLRPLSTAVVWNGDGNDDTRSNIEPQTGI